MPTTSPTSSPSETLRQHGRFYLATIPALAVFFWGLVILSRWSGNVEPVAKAPTQSPKPQPIAKPSQTAALEREVEAAQRALRAARDKAVAARLEFERLVRQAQEAPEPNERPAASTPVEPKSSGELPLLKDAQGSLAAGPSPAPKVRQPRLIPNAEFQALAERVRELEGQRNRLLDRLRPEHPLVQDLDQQIGGVKQRLTLLPELIAAPNEDLATEENAVPAPQKPVEITPAPAPPVAQPIRQRPNSAELKKARLASENAQRTVEQRERAEELAVQRRMALAANADSASDKPDAPSIAVPTQANGTPTLATNWTPWTMVSLLSVLAAAAGIAMARFAPQGNSVFANAAQVEAALKLPVMGLIPASNAATLKSDNVALASFCQLILYGCEATFALLIFLVVALAITHPSSFQEFAANPIDAMAHGIHRFLHF